MALSAGLVLAQRVPDVRGTSDATRAGAPAPVAGGMRVYTDPSTGAILDEPLPGAAAPLVARGAAGARQSLGVSAAGGVKAAGDFRMSMGTHTDAAGRTTTDCVPAAGRTE